MTKALGAACQSNKKKNVYKQTFFFYLTGCYVDMIRKIIKPQNRKAPGPERTILRKRKGRLTKKHSTFNATHSTASPNKNEIICIILSGSSEQ